MTAKSTCKPLKTWLSLGMNASPGIGLGLPGCLHTGHHMGRKRGRSPGLIFILASPRYGAKMAETLANEVIAVQRRFPLLLYFG